MSPTADDTLPPKPAAAPPGINSPAASSRRSVREEPRTEPLQILVVEDEEDFRESLTLRLTRKGHQVSSYGSGAAALEAIRNRPHHVALVDLHMEGLDGLAVLGHLKTMHPLTQVVMLTGHGSIETAIEAMKLGAYDYLQKPCEPAKLELLLEKAYDKWRIASYARELEGRIEQLNLELQGRHRFQNMIGRSPVMQEVYSRIEAAGRTHATIMIIGESGTGKELVARAIHYGGMLAEKPFIPINCAALPKDLIESELFGYKKGSFTSAVSDSAGLFKAAEGGTLFLDEITEMATETQAKLLRVLQEKAIRPVGQTREIPIDVRIITSTNRNLLDAVKGGLLREDLYYRLSVATIRLPSLRERMEDLPLLIRHFLDKFNERGGRSIEGVQTQAMEILARYPWPGNVRELENVVEAAYAFGKGAMLEKSDLPHHIIECRESPPAAGFPFSDVITIRQAERLLMIRALQKFEGNKAQAARSLGISRKQFYVKLELYGIKSDECS